MESTDSGIDIIDLNDVGMIISSLEEDDFLSGHDYENGFVLSMAYRIRELERIAYGANNE